jgi:2-polyprenyl-3-methyl-5-hydroxy-6-metoxy-1,4-benzoquinol methylase
VPDKSNDSEKLAEYIDDQVGDTRVTLGRHTSDDYINDPKHIAFVASRYKFVAKMLAGKTAALEIGCGDGFGAPFIAQVVDRLYCTDIHGGIIEDDKTRLKFLKNTEFSSFDFRKSRFDHDVDAIYMIDVIEHFYPHEEPEILANAIASLSNNGIMLVGTPNKAAEQYASQLSRDAHVNLKTHASLKETFDGYFDNVFIFGMNDEVLHTGYGPMCHFLWALCTGPKLLSNKTDR